MVSGTVKPYYLFFYSTSALMMLSIAEF